MMDINKIRLSYISLCSQRSGHPGIGSFSDRLDQFYLLCCSQVAQQSNSLIHFLSPPRGGDSEEYSELHEMVEVVIGNDPDINRWRRLQCDLSILRILEDRDTRPDVIFPHYNSEPRVAPGMKIPHLSSSSNP